ncbi:hypothetical protein C8J56DRAFT_144819 [Mycena floridula]|nr:hypothetical protein C8J56DRAFT_144819 [Mycena floridula]
MFSELPTELVFLIMETLLEMYPSEALGLTLLSRDIKPIAERALYRYIILDSYPAMNRLLETMKSGSRPPNFYANHVQSICVAKIIDLDELLFLVTVCPNIQSLAVFHWAAGDFDMDTIFLDMLSKPARPSRLSCDLRWGSPSISSRGPSRFTLPFFQNITHLELYDLKNFGNQFNGTASLQCLRRLTHLSLSLTFPEDNQIYALVRGLNLSDSLQLCLVYPDCSYNKIVLVRTICAQLDPRIVFVCKGPSFGQLATADTVIWRNSGKLVEQWGRPGDRGLDMWEMGERLVLLQRAKRED